MKKHAYLIMAHNEFEILKILLHLLDDEQNDIYLHIDRKAGCVNEQEFLDCVNKSKLIILKNRLDVTWGHYSQIECEVQLLEDAISNQYYYYHLLSGVDLPIKSQKKIHDFFENCGQKEFVHFDSTELNPIYIKRVSKYWLIKGRNRSVWRKIVNKTLMSLQICVNRAKTSGLAYQKGANWFSITHDLAQYVVQNRAVIKKYFNYTMTGDEMFLQTLVASSDFINKVYYYGGEDDYCSIQREIDWKRGNPYVYKKDDFEELISSTKLFARKFSWEIDCEIVKLIEKYVMDDYNS